MWEDGGEEWVRVESRAEECAWIAVEFLALERKLMEKWFYSREYEAEFARERQEEPEMVKREICWYGDKDMRTITMGPIEFEGRRNPDAKYRRGYRL
jgi:hypothetical protein